MWTRKTTAAATRNSKNTKSKHQPAGPECPTDSMPEKDSSHDQNGNSGIVAATLKTDAHVSMRAASKSWRKAFFMACDKFSLLPRFPESLNLSRKAQSACPLCTGSLTTSYTCASNRSTNASKDALSGPHLAILTLMIPASELR